MVVAFCLKLIQVITAVPIHKRSNFICISGLDLFTDISSLNVLLPEYAIAVFLEAISSHNLARLFEQLNSSAGSFTWTSPPPAWTPTNGDDVRTVDFTVLNGSTNVALRWNYTLGSGETVVLTTWKIDENDLGLLTTALSTVVYDNRFVISTSEVATVIIKNVADINDATFECKVQTSVGAWKYKIRVEITGERQFKIV